jgi:hypothetical protein
MGITTTNIVHTLLIVVCNALFGCRTNIWAYIKAVSGKILKLFKLIQPLIKCVLNEMALTIYSYFFVIATKK